MPKRLATGALLLIIAAPLHAQSVDIGAANAGISIGNSPRWTGLRINWRDVGVQRVTGVNVTLWRPGENPDFRMDGIAAGIVGPGVGTLNGIGIGLGGVVAERALRGVAIAGLGVVSQGRVSGAALAGLGVVAEGDLRGLSIAGLGVVSQGRMTGITVAGLGAVAQGALTGISIAGLGVVSEGPLMGMSVAGLGLVSQGGATGISVAGLGTVAQGDMRGINVGGLAVVAEGRMVGLNTGGLALVANRGVRGVNIGGLVVVGDRGPIDGLTATLGAVESGEAIRGAAFGGYRVKAPRVDGLAAAIAMMRTDDMRGLSIAGYNEVRGLQTGLTIGLYNSADVLRGVQIGLLNRAKNNRPPFRWLPILNLHF